jgi:hypothetical protein
MIATKSGGIFQLFHGIVQVIQRLDREPQPFARAIVDFFTANLTDLLRVMLP